MNIRALAIAWLTVLFLLASCSPPEAVQHVAQGKKLAEQGQVDQAIGEYTQAIEHDPRLAEAHYRRGLAYLNTSDFDRAIADFDQAIAINPGQPEAFANRGLAHFRNDDLAPAIADFDQALQLNPDYLFACARRGIAYEAQGDRDRATADADRVIAADPKNAEDYYSRGLAYATKDEQDRAIAEFDKAIDLGLQDAEVYRARGLSYAVSQDLAHALADYNRAIALNPNSVMAYDNRGHAYAYIHDFDRAIADYDKAIQLTPDKAWGYYGRGNVYAYTGDYDRAIADYDKTIQLKPDLAEAYFNRGFAQEANGAIENAMADFQKVVDLTNDQDLRKQAERQLKALHARTPAGAEAERQARITAAEAAVPSLIRETGLITSVVPLLTAGQGDDLEYEAVELYFDGKWLWVRLADRLVALDPETRDIVTGPVQLEQAADDVLFDGQQLWISQLTDRGDEFFHGYYRKHLHTVDLGTGRVGPAVEANIWSGSPLVSDGQHLWFIAIDGADEAGRGRFVLQAVDTTSHAVSPQIETGTTPWRLVADKTRQVLWIISGRIQQYDLRQNTLRDTTLQLGHTDLNIATIHFDGQRLWTVDHGPDTFQSLDVDTGRKTVWTVPEEPFSGNVRAAASVPGNNVIWFSTGGQRIIQTIDVQTGQLGPIIPTYDHPGALAFDGQRLWLALRSSTLNTGDFVGLQYIVPKD